MATPAHDASSNSGSQLNKSSTNAYSHTAGTLTHGIAIIRVSAQDSTPGTLTGVTYNGAAATQIGTTATFASSNRHQLSLWYYLNPPAGASAVVATFSEVMNDHIVIVSTYSNVDQTTPIDTANIVTVIDFDTVNPSEGRATITSATGKLVVGAGYFASPTGAGATTNTSRGNVLESGTSNLIGLEDTAGASVVLSCTISETVNNCVKGASLNSDSGEAQLISGKFYKFFRGKVA